MTEQIAPPEIGSLWKGQGGIYAGEYTIDGQDYYLIRGGILDAARWGEIGESSTGLLDGKANTELMTDSPAAASAKSYYADGHDDFYLPSSGEAGRIRENVGHAFIGHVWTSSGRSDHDAYAMHYDSGRIGSILKTTAVQVMPIRRIPK